MGMDISVASEAPPSEYILRKFAYQYPFPSHGIALYYLILEMGQIGFRN
jgi:hypothetical protein